ncbi:hypothetical protein TNCV_1246001 [Trichonephila clavipes]|uniref:Uncharacterized protein n=1 Tax=Trichonephila clavipes TaxID=2585209 RepID=A0A8X6RIP5_TRICX|nr:hypothetical protein TNCV_1246001 [Trichonephila clavipes]
MKVNLTTDGAPSLTGSVIGVLAMGIIDDDLPHFFPYNSIIYQQGLYCNILNLRHVMRICMEIANPVQGRILQRKTFLVQL